jgi:hypothetical protein
MTKFTVEQKIATVQTYIHVLKGVEIPVININGVFDLMKLDKAFNVAYNYFRNNNIKLDLI